MSTKQTNPSHFIEYHFVETPFHRTVISSDEDFAHLTLSSNDHSVKCLLLPYSKDVEILTENISSKENVEHNSKFDYCKTWVDGKYMYRWREFKMGIPQETEERRQTHIVIQRSEG